MSTLQTKHLRFTDIGLATDNVPRLRAFYETVFGGKAGGDEWHSSLAVEGVFFAFVHCGTLRENPTFQFAATGAANNLMMGFEVEDVDAEHQRLLALGVAMLNAPATHPWGARSFQFKDPDGNVLNFHNRPKQG
ncbi:MAG: VOC family protein [Kiritimatiellaeota bacterium]|nr:VOC family protein [Kiritimatiellota bacterium]